MNASMAVGTKGSCDQACEFLDLIEQFEHGDEARSFAEEISCANKLPLTTRCEP
jgi:hypothetical protein